jgi:hypothetical protein
MSNSSSKNVKVYRNSDRNKPMAHKKYVPQYQLLGIEPEEVRSSVVPDGTILPKTVPQLPLTNPRSVRASVRQPYAQIIPSPVGRGKDPVPNVGNNMEHTWSSVNGEIIDDLAPEIDDQIIDNNDFVDVPEPIFFEEEAKTEETNDFVHQDNFPDALPSVKDDECILLVDNTVIDVGTAEYIQEIAKTFIFGDHSLCAGNPIPTDRLMVLKKLKIKVGVFVE